MHIPRRIQRVEAPATTIPVWRKGRYEKPLLRNACGLHFKAKGTLEKYLPKIAQQNLSMVEETTCHKKSM
ncbi:hypothetical protein MTR_8g039350 [Medicago truncatula]|uniref:Uncharacterized protein n=1 Tax=Medicago truncatula TaxID=3880 RepID=G7LG37_MEDTR|nr:hypothetical protein MTR_8g039350 [Medicago truncatula]